MSDGPEWFAAKRYGYGAGLPIAWQGWALLIGFIAATIGAAVALGRRPAAMLAIVIPLAILFMLITMRTTRGGWRWRWGEKE